MTIGSSLLMPSFFQIIEKPSARSCCAQFLQMNSCEEIDPFKKKILKLFLESELATKDNDKIVNEKIKKLTKLDPKNLKEVFSIAHDLSIKNNQIELALLYKREIEKIENENKLENFNPNLKYNLEFLMTNFFLTIEKPSAEICCAQFLRMNSNEEIDSFKTTILELFLISELTAKDNDKIISEKIKKLDNLDPESLKEIFSIAHDLSIKNNQTELVLFYKKEIEKIEKENKLENFNPNLKYNVDVFKNSNENSTTIWTIAKVVVVAAGLLSIGLLLSAASELVYGPCLNKDELGYLAHCINKSPKNELYLSKTSSFSGFRGFSFQPACERVLISGKPISSDLYDCIRFEEQQQGHYEKIFNQTLSTIQDSQLLDSQEKGMKLIKEAKNIKVSNRDFYLNKIISRCNDQKVQVAAIDEMTSLAKDKALAAVISQKIKNNDCQSAFEIAKVNKDHFQKIFLECNDNDDIRESIIASWNLKYRFSNECVLNCVSEKIKDYGNKENILIINGRPATPEEDNCIQTCATKLIDRKIEQNLRKHLTERHSA